MIKYLLLKAVFVSFLIILPFSVASWANQSLSEIAVYAQDEDDDDDEDEDDDEYFENCPIGALYDEVRLEDGCVERRFYQATTDGGCQISQSVLSCPTSLFQTTACDPDSSWSIVAAGCDSAGFFYEVRYNLCTGLIEPYHNPRVVTGVCQQPIIDLCQTDDQFNDFLGCKQTECGVAIYACDSDRGKQREYEDGGETCFQSQFNQACAELEEEEEDDEEEEGAASPVASFTRPTTTFSPSPTTTPPPSVITPAAIFELTAQVKGKAVDLNNLEIEPGQPITLTVQTPNRLPQDLLCQWHLDNLVNEDGRALLVETDCRLTETFHPDSLNLGVVQVSATVVDKNSHQVIGQIKAAKFKVKDPYPDNSCLLGEDPQLIKQCIIKLTKLNKEPKSGKPLTNIMLCLLDQEGVPTLLGSQPTTTSSLFEQVSLAKQAILKGEVSLWASYPLCLNR